MTLPGVTLFPQSLLPLRIFEPRYRRMLADTLLGERMFCVAMPKPGRPHSPVNIAGLGLIRAAVTHKDGTSHLILQGIARVELEAAVRYRPYRVHKIHPMISMPHNSVKVDALVAKVRDLLVERFQLGMPFPFPLFPASVEPEAEPPALPAKDILNYLDKIASPEQVADLVSCVVLPDASDRQTILEMVDVEARLHQLVRFMVDEIKQQNKKK